MDEHQTSSIIQWYEDLEERLIEFLKFFPFTAPNLNIPSPRLAGLITESCNILEALFHEAANFQREPQITITCKKCGHQREKRNLDITDYAKFYTKFLELPVVKSFMFTSPPQYVIPFKEWLPILSGGDYASLPWWSAYTKLKHNRIKNIGQATLTNTVHALCGLHQTIAKLPDLVRTTIRHGWSQVSIHDLESTIERLERRSPSTIDNCLVESKLFAVPIGGSKPFPDDIADFRPFDYRCSERTVMFMGKS